MAHLWRSQLYLPWLQIERWKCHFLQYDITLHRWLLGLINSWFHRLGGQPYPHEISNKSMIRESQGCSLDSWWKSHWKDGFWFSNELCLQFVLPQILQKSNHEGLEGYDHIRGRGMSSFRGFHHERKM